MSSSRSFSPTLALELSPSRLQIVAWAGLALPLLAVPLALPLDWPYRLLWLAGHTAVSLGEAMRCGILTPWGRPAGIGRYRREWTLSFADGRRVRGELRRCWVNRFCAYVEVGEGRRRARSALIWRDTLPADGYRHLCAHLRVH